MTLTQWYLQIAWLLIYPCLLMHPENIPHHPFIYFGGWASVAFGIYSLTNSFYEFMDDDTEGKQ